MSDARVIVDLELWQIRNQAKTLLRSPLRLAMWVVSIGLGIVFVGARFTAARYVREQGPPLSASIAMLYTAALIAVLGIFAIRNSTREGARFASVVEANFVASSRLSARSVFVWLQARALWRTVLRTLVVIFILGTSDLAHGAEMPRLTALGLLVVLIPPAYAFHLGIASQRIRTAARIAGALALALAALVALDKIPGADRPAIAAAHGAWWPFVAAFALVCAGVLIPARDPMPELFATTSVGLAGTRSRAARTSRIPNAARSSDRFFDLEGPWVILSARLVAFFRQRTPLAFALGLAGWFAGGLAAGIAQRLLGAVAAQAFLSGGLSIGFLIVILFASVGYQLGTEVRNPLWWSGDADITARLAVDSLASTWRLGVSLLGLLAGYASTGRFHEAAQAFVLFTSFLWLARCNGYLLYAFFPARIDQRGGLAGLRVFIVFALAAPVVAIAAIGALLGLSAVALTAAVVMTTIVEALVLLTIAAKRIDGRVEAYV